MGKTVYNSSTQHFNENYVINCMSYRLREICDLCRLDAKYNEVLTNSFAKCQHLVHSHNPSVHTFFHSRLK